MQLYKTDEYSINKNSKNAYPVSNIQNTALDDILQENPFPSPTLPIAI